MKKNYSHMTEEQKTVMISIFQTGMAEGLGHPFEFFTAYINRLSLYDYKRIEKMQEDAYGAMIEFMRGAAGCEEEEDFYRNMDVVQLNTLINNYYKFQHLR